VNDDYETVAEKGALEIELKVDKAPIRGPDDLKITKANWRGIKRDTEKLVKRQGSVKVSSTGVNLHIIVETPVGQTRCEIPSEYCGNAIIPEKSTLQSVMVWLGRGGRAPGGLIDEGAVLSIAAFLGYLVGEKTVGELEFED
jgi:hypothetical protein